MDKRSERGIFAFVLTTLIVMGLPLQSVAIGATGAAETRVAETKVAETGVLETGAAETGVLETIEKEYRYQDGQELPKIEETIIDEAGNKYRLVSYDDPVEDPAYVRPSQYYTWQITKDIPVDGIDRLYYYFAESIYIEDEHFIGNIPLAANPFYIVNIYESFTGQVDRLYKMEGLPDVDVIRLPTQMDFTVSSDAFLGAVQTVTLNLVFVDYEITGTNPLGLPNSYTANLTYRGEESWLELYCYNVTAYYAGDIDSTIEQYVIKSRYELVVEPVVMFTPVAPVMAVTIPQQELPMARGISPYLAFAAVATVIVLVLGWLFVWFLLLRNNACLVRTAEDKREVLLRKRIAVVAGEATFEVPDKLDLFDRAQYSIELKPRLAKQKGELLVTWRNRVIARSPFNASIQIDMNNIVVDAVIGVLSETPALMTGIATEA